MTGKNVLFYIPANELALYDAARRIAYIRNESVSRIARDAIKRYVKRHQGMLNRVDRAMKEERRGKE